MAAVCSCGLDFCGRTETGLVVFFPQFLPAKCMSLYFKFKHVKFLVLPLL